MWSSGGSGIFKMGTNGGIMSPGGIITRYTLIIIHHRPGYWINFQLVLNAAYSSPSRINCMHWSLKESQFQYQHHKNARQRLVTSTSIAQCNDLILRLGWTGDPAFEWGPRPSLTPLTAPEVVILRQSQHQTSEKLLIVFQLITDVALSIRAAVGKVWFPWGFPWIWVWDGWGDCGESPWACRISVGIFERMSD